MEDFLLRYPATINSHCITCNKRRRITAKPYNRFGNFFRLPHNGLGFRNLLSDFFEADDLSFDRLWKKDWVPAVNVTEGEKNYEIELAAPGMLKEDFKVNIDHGVLTISCDRKEEKEETKKNYTRQEFRFHSFSRSFTLPENAKEENIKAQYTDGMLKLNIAKQAMTVSKTKEIAVS
jgi:HSP20 family protein